MKKISVLLVLVICALLITSSIAIAETDKSDKCTTIQSGVLLASDGEPLTTGYNDWGYNYQARLFNGMYCDAYYDVFWCQAYADVKLSMKWNDAWLSNQDCNGDGLLDRPDDFGGSYIGSGACTTNHMSGEYEIDDGKICKWNWFLKIIAVPEGAVLEGGMWFTADDIEIGQAYWGPFAMIQSIYNDPCGGYGGVEYLSPSGPGLGKW